MSQIKKGVGIFSEVAWLLLILGLGSQLSLSPTAFAQYGPPSFQILGNYFGWHYCYRQANQMECSQDPFVSNRNS